MPKSYKGGMTKKDYAEWCRWIAYLKAQCLLNDWIVEISYKNPDSPNRSDGLEWGASSKSTPGRKVVLITIPNPRCWPTDELLNTMVHELIHAHLVPLQEMIREDLGAHLGQQAYGLFNDSATRNLEYAVDALAGAISKNLKQIKWPSDD